MVDQGNPVVAVALIEKEGEQAKLRVTLPFGLRVRADTRLLVDQNPALQMPFITCVPVNKNLGCIAEYDATPDLVASSRTVR